MSSVHFFMWDNDTLNEFSYLSAKEGQIHSKQRDEGTDALALHDVNYKSEICLSR